MCFLATSFAYVHGSGCRKLFSGRQWKGVHSTQRASTDFRAPTLPWLPAPAGSRQLGVPTANLPPEPLAAQLAGLPDGVYFGCGLSSAGVWSSCLWLLVAMGCWPQRSLKVPEALVSAAALPLWKLPMPGERLACLPTTDCAGGRSWMWTTAGLRQTDRCAW